MDQTVSFCDKTIEKAAIKINDTESTIKQQVKKKEYEEIKKAVTSNEAATKRVLHQQKFKKPTKPRPTVKVEK